MPLSDKQREEIIDKLAAIEHERWSHWQEYMFDCAIKSGDDNIGIRTFSWPTAQVERWNEQMETEYECLTEEEKQSDRDQVMRYWPLIEKFLDQELDRRDKINQEDKDWAIHEAISKLQ